MIDYYTPKQIAEKLSLNAYTVRKFIVNGELDAINFGSGKKASYRIKKESLDKFIKNRSKA